MLSADVLFKATATWQPVTNPLDIRSDPEDIDLRRVCAIGFAGCDSEPHANPAWMDEILLHSGRAAR